MPENKRGDFVAIDGDGAIFANRQQVAALLRKTTLTLPEDLSRRVSAPTYPPGVFAGSGPYVREYSRLGVLATIAYVRIKCDDTHFAPKDAGYLYSGAVGEGRSQIDAGLQYNADDSIAPFLNISGVKPWPSLVNDGQRYRCGQTLALLFGALPGAPSKLVMATGVVEQPSTGSFDTDTWVDAAWLFFAPPRDFLDPGKDAGGAPTLCKGCYTKRMTSIGQDNPENVFNGSCFGGCATPTDAGILWERVAMGQLAAINCNGQTARCTSSFRESPAWYGSLQFYSGSNSHAIHHTTELPRAAYEGFGLIRY